MKIPGKNAYAAGTKRRLKKSPALAVVARMPAPQPAPSVHLLLGLRAAFLLPDATSRARSHQRYARDRDVSEAVVDAIVAETITDVSSERVLGVDLALDAEMRSDLRRQLAAAMACVDFAAQVKAPIPVYQSLDLAARLAAFSVLTDRPAPTRIPGWFDDRDNFVRALLPSDVATKELHDTCRTRADAGLSTIGKRCLDGILAGDPIGSEDVLLGTDAVLKTHLPESQHVGLRVRLRLHYAARSIVGALQKIWGRAETREWCVQLLRDWNHMHWLMVALQRAGRLGTATERDDKRLKVILIGGLAVLPYFSPFHWFVYAHTDSEFSKRLKAHLEKNIEQQFEPRERRVAGRAILKEMGATQGAFTVLFQANLNDAIEKYCSEHDVSLDGDTVWIALREIPRTGTPEELNDVAERLKDLHDDHPDDPRILVRRAIVHFRLGQKQLAKTLANRAAQLGNIIAKVLIEQAPHLLTD